MATARAVANFFVAKGVSEGVVIDQLKLQKLVYYSYCWYLANKNEKLFDEDIEAWDHGPVIRDLWNAFNKFGRGAITEFASAIRAAADGVVRSYTPTLDFVKDADAVAALNKIWEVYKQYDGIQLSNLSNAEGEPWQLVKSASPAERRPIITDDIISKVFKAKLAAG